MKLSLHMPDSGRRARARSTQGVALIISLILLAVITFMAVTFLVVSRSERGAVATSTDQTVAREAANAAADRAVAELMASIFATNHPGNFGLAVSTNFINSRPFVPGLESHTNVNYTLTDGTMVRDGNAELNAANLFYNPRPPVFITRTVRDPNSGVTYETNEFRYYHDLNRNSRYDTNGVLPVVAGMQGGSPQFFDTNYNLINFPQQGVTVSNFMVGDPEWIGRLERPDLPHSSSNRFVYRYAYLVAPAGKALDLNSVHNYARRFTDNLDPASGDGFTRNMGVGTWEMNLAAFLVDLNTNYWPYGVNNAYGTRYFYETNLSTFNRGSAFEDAMLLLRYRYATNINALSNFAGLFGDFAAEEFGRDWRDGYLRGPLLRGPYWNPVTGLYDPDYTYKDQPWMGSDNPNRFFNPQELWDASRISLNFSNRLWTAGTNNDSYNRYTYYRLLSQIGTDSSVDSPRGKINLNYDNRVQGWTNPVTKSVVVSATNFIGWRAIDFFTNAAQRLIENAGYSRSNVSINYIQLYPTNFYTPSIHQLLQLSANIYDATTNRILNAGVPYPHPPSVFRPLFAVTNGPGGTNIVFIRGYEEVEDASAINSPLNTSVRWWELGTNTPAAIAARDMLWGVPLVIGAKKGLPNFNEMAMQTMVQMTRKLEFRRENNLPTGNINETNVMYTLSISNVVGLEAWNSYLTNYPRSLSMRTSVEMYATVTNEFNQALLPTQYVIRSNTIMVTPPNWSGYQNPNYSAASFQIPLPPLGTNAFYFLSNSIYRTTPPRFEPLANQLIGFERYPGAPRFVSPRWWLMLRARIQFALVDTSVTPFRIIDFVNLDSKDEPLDLAGLFSIDGDCVRYPSGLDGAMWCTNRLGDATGTNISRPTIGILNQIAASTGEVEAQNWNSDPQVKDKQFAQQFFQAQFMPAAPGGPFTHTNVFYSPFVPSRTLYYRTELQVNDPLVHYTLGDLRDAYDNYQTNRITFHNAWSTNNIGAINKRFEPWGGGPLTGSGSPTGIDTRFDRSVKDPMVTRSDDWDFPTNKFPNIGWLGRVHRGTPWQTINLKSEEADLKKWQRYSGNSIISRNVGQYDTNMVPYLSLVADGEFTRPVHDRRILDLFTTAVNDNAVRGQLSVNNTNLAAWSAVLSGVNVLANINSNYFIEPAGIYHVTNPTPVAKIVQGIQAVQSKYPSGLFNRLGDVLAVPEMTVNSPFIQSAKPLSPTKTDMTDAVYERIPQQILGLLKGPDQPRFVIYAYGQTLKPADRSLVASGPYMGVCTNYQIMAEAATRTVVRIEGTPNYRRTVGTQDRLNNLRAVVESFNILPPE